MQNRERSVGSGRRYWVIAAVVAFVLGAPVAPAGAARGVKPTQANVKYGPHERHVMDIWLAKPPKPGPIVVYIHGGGFRMGDKSSGASQPMLAKCLAAGVSFASINYRFTKHATYDQIMFDGARAIQVIRANAKTLRIDPARIGVYGSSAGAIMSLWLAFHNDVGDRRSRDPVTRYSSTVKVAGALATPVGTEQMALRHISRGDPPIFQYNSTNPADTRNVHHPSHAISVKKLCDRAGIESVLLLKRGTPAFKGDATAEMAKFFFKHLGVKPAGAKPTTRPAAKPTGRGKR